ncbi:MAG: preprotein translocase subunit SecY [Oscillospiraceae bacterium]|nr:preprotein translocase subunit SecY [Oscillospiraceae bacterium]
MLQTIRNAWKVAELRKKILFTLLILLLYRVGNAVPVPYVNLEALSTWFEGWSNSILGLFNVMSGGALSSATVFALSIQPYINASIIIQLLTIAIPALERMAKEEGEEGKEKINKITRYSTIAIALLQGFGYYMLLRANSMGSVPLLTSNGIWEAVVIITTFVAGSALVMWMGEQITEFGIGNGISIILFASIVSRFPTGVANAISNIASGALAWWVYVLLLLGALLMIILIVAVNNAERRVPVQYSKRVVGRKMYGGQSTHLPMKVNMSGVLPVIFAQSIASLPGTIANFTGTQITWFDTNSWLYALVYFLLIIFFSYFYSTIQFNPIEVSNNLKRNGGFIPGYRPGKPTSEFLQKVLNKVTLFGAIFLSIVAVTPYIIGILSPTASRSGISLGGTSIIIVVGVALETVQALENQMLMRHYKGFLE